MLVGVPTEVKPYEYRVALAPAGVRALVEAGHRVLVQRGAGAGSGIDDEAYRRAGARIVPDAEAVFGEAELVVKVKEPQPAEWPLLRRGQVLFAFLHLAADARLARALLDRGVVAIAYETIELPDRTLPLLTPMSEVAGRLAIQVGARALEKPSGGRGVLLAGLPGVEPGRVAILGAGVVGTNAARVAAGLGADVTVLDVNVERLRRLDDLFRGRVKTVVSNPYAIEAAIAEADLVVGAVLVVGARTPRLITRRMLGTMRRGAVIVDVAVDQGGCAETTRPTTHAEPLYEVDGIVHYAVANMPSAVARTATFALTNATFPYVKRLADKGYVRAMREDPALARGLNACLGRLTQPAVARDLGLEHVPVEQALAAVEG
ncbi:MAG TPA: alanine dehydrogenase [Thermodesulfobacteriota bacterium]|nr:alanine dehydrogenase [Thermodesulfobacteriota bacterium]